MPFDVVAYLRLIGRALRDARSLRAAARVLAIALACPMLIALGSLGMLLDRVIFPGLRSTRIERPVFVTGLDGSGQGRLVRLLARAPGFESVLLWEALLPSLTQRRLVSWLAELDREYLQSRLATRVRAFEDRVFAAARRRGPAGLSQPVDDTTMIAATFLHASIGPLLPYPRTLAGLVDFDERSPRHRARAMRFYRRCLRRRVYRAGRQRATHLGHGPGLVGMLISLREAFPDARFVVTLRNPFEAIPGVLATQARRGRELGWTRAEIDDALGVVGEQTLHAFAYPFEALADLPPERCVFVRYEDLVDEPAKTVEAICERLGIAATGGWQAALEQARQRPARHREEPLERDDAVRMSVDEIGDALGEAIDRFGWSPAPPTRAGAEPAGGGNARPPASGSRLER